MLQSWIEQELYVEITPLPDGRLAIVFSAEEERALDVLDATTGKPARFHSAVVYEQLMQPNNPNLVELIASLGMSPR